MTSPLDQKKIKITGPVVVTANRVADGAVVYRRADGGWTTHLDDAAIATDSSGANQLIDARSPTICARSAPISPPSSSPPAARSGPAICASSFVSAVRPSSCR